MLAMARQAPELLRRTEHLTREIDRMAEDGIRLDEETAHAIGRAKGENTRSGRVALWVIAATLLYLAWQVT